MQCVPVAPWGFTSKCNNPNCGNACCPNYKGGTPPEFREAGIMVAGTFVKADDIDYGSDRPIVVDAGPYPGNEPERYAGVDLAENPPPLPERIDGPAGILALAYLPGQDGLTNITHTNRSGFVILEDKAETRFNPRSPATWTAEQIYAFNRYRHVTVQDSTPRPDFGTSTVRTMEHYAVLRIADERRKIAAYLRQINDTCHRFGEKDHAIVDLNAIIDAIEKGNY